MSSKTRIQLEEWLKTIDVKADSVLDIGGSQYPVKGRTKSWDVKDYKILDLKHPHKCVRKPDIIADLNRDGEVDENDLMKYGSTYDIVFFIEVMEYIYNPLEALLSTMNLIKENGILYLSTHFIYPVHNPVEDDFMRLTPNGIEKLLKESGFGIMEHLSRKATSNKLLEFYSEEGMRPAKDIDHLAIGSLIKAVKYEM